ncbi:MAG: hypothetical protein EKK63_10715 [Acinetobacter sp.]|uniref:hypothetical protein n=1 Tax=Acinetobacter sp. TaxID=472 RepID=UPI000FB4D4EE|nr:hypothetical protein [Acinetobacter sp.]RUP39024.1 MAG: hypothetical protein EKK63_10715 [Acinetobacter sp.]
MQKNRLTINNEFYKLFRHRVSGAQNTSAVSKEQYVLFKEHVDLLQKAEQFICDIQDGIWDENWLAELFERKNNRRKIDQVCAELDTFRFPLNLLSNPILSSSVYFEDLRKNYERLDNDCQWEIARNLKLTNLLAYRKATNEYSKQAFIYRASHYQNWSVENFPMRQVQQLISLVRANTQYRLQKTQKMEEFVQHQIENEYLVFQNFLKANSSLYVFVFDIRFINFSLINYREEEKKFWAENANIVQCVKLVLSQIVGCIYGLVKIEPDFRSGINLHCILYLKSAPTIDEKQIVDDLKCLFRTNQINLNQIKIRNWNAVLRKHYSKQAVGFLKSTDTTKIRAFKQWVLNYFFKIDQYLQLHSENYLHGQLNQNFMGVPNYEVLHETLKSAQASMQKLLKPSDALNFNEKSTWSTRHLSKNAKDRINLSKRYYRALDEASSKSLNYLEIFIETLLDSSFYAFDLRQDQSDISELTVPVLEKALTRIGRQFISLSEHYVHIKDSLLYHQLFSEKINFQLILNFKQSVAAKSIKLKHLVDIDNHIAKLRDFLNLPLTQLAGQSIATHRLNQYKLYQDRIDTTNQYLKPLLKNDVKAFYVKFQLVFKYKKTQQSEFSELFTKFLHQAKRARPLYWMSGYWGFWRENQDTTPYAEIIFFLDNNAFNVRDDQILKWLKAEWESCLDKHCKPAMLMLVPEKIIRKKLEITHVFSERWRSWSATIEIAPNWSALIESVNKERQKKLLTESVPEFIVDCTFQEKPNNNIPKVLIKGNKPRKKQKVSKKDSSGTDEPQDT